MPDPIATVLVTAMALMVPICLAFRSAFLARNVRVGMIGGVLTTAAVCLVTVIAFYLAMPHLQMQGVGIVILCAMIAGGAFGMLGVYTRNWWESLPRNADR